MFCECEEDAGDFVAEVVEEVLVDELCVAFR